MLKTNEEIIKEQLFVQYIELDGERWDGLVEKVDKLMDLARADERDKMMKENTFIEGYNKGCLETKEKMKLEIRRLEKCLRWDKLGNYAPYAPIQKSTWELFKKELSCPEAIVRSNCYDAGYNKGCLETERKIINKLIAIHQMGDDNLLRYIQEWLQSRELESKK